MATAKTRMTREARRIKENIIILEARSDLFGEASRLWAEKGFQPKTVTVIMVGN